MPSFETIVDFPEWQTQRLQLRRIEEGDLDEVYRGLSDPKVIKHYGVSYDSKSGTREQMDWYRDLWKLKQGIWWAICLRQTGAFIGCCGFNNYDPVNRLAELGFWLLPQFWGRGFGTEAVASMLNFAFAELELNRMEALVEQDNASSERLLLRLGFVKEGVLRECEYKDDNFIDIAVFSLLSEEI